jgi:hypothetical protein
VLHRIEFRTVRRKKDESDVCRYLQHLLAGFVPRCSVEYQAEEFPAVSSREFFQKTLMHGCMHAGENQRVHCSVLGTEGGEGVRIFSDGLLGDSRTKVLGCPAICRARDASEARFILEEDTERQTLEFCFKRRALHDQGEKEF